VAFTIADRGSEISVFDFARETSTRVTVDREFAFLPRWAPGGQRIVFQSDRDGPLNLYSVASDGSGQVERLTTSSNEQWPNSVTRDGTILFAELRPTTGFDIFRLPFAASQGAARTTPSDDRLSEATELLSTPSQEYAANISPNGRYFAYQAAVSDGRFAVYVRAYPDASRGPWQISTGGGTAPVWAHSGRELFYLDESNTLMAAPVDTLGPQFSVGRPAKVFDTKYWGDFYSYDVTPEARFLMLKDVGQSQASMVVVLNWFEELSRRMPTR
jgi:Tol biopolymer transport system component